MANIMDILSSDLSNPPPQTDAQSFDNLADASARRRRVEKQILARAAAARRGVGDPSQFGRPSGLNGDFEAETRDNPLKMQRVKFLI